MRKNVGTRLGFRQRVLLELADEAFVKGIGIFAHCIVRCERACTIVPMKGKHSAQALSFPSESTVTWITLLSASP